MLHVFKSLNNDDFLEEFDHSNFFFKNTELNSEIINGSKRSVVLNSKGIESAGDDKDLLSESGDLGLGLFPLVIVAFSCLEDDDPLLVLLDVNDQLVVLLNNGVIVVSAGIKLTSEDLAVVNQSVEEIEFWREGTEVEALEAGFDSLLLGNLNCFDFS